MQHNYRHDVTREELAGLYHAGLSVKEIAAWFRCSETLVNTRVAEWGLSRRCPSKGHYRVKVDVGDLVRRYTEEFHSVHRISRAIGHSPTFVMTTLKRAGVVMRSPKDYRGEHWRGAARA